MPEVEIGKVTHFFDRISVIIIELADTLKVGDRIHVLGNTTDFEEEVTSIQIEHENVEEARGGDVVGVKVSQKAREGDVVCKVVEE